MSSEFEIISQLLAKQKNNDELIILPAGDDAAVIKIPEGFELVISTDTLVSGVHFFPDTQAELIGYKSLAVNLSDLAAMAAQPRWIMLSLTLPEMNSDWLNGFSNGFYTLAQEYGVSLIGGDITRGPLSITIQAQGLVEAGKAVKRSQARAGDFIYVSNRLGEAALGLAVIEQSLNKGDYPTALEQLNKPKPQVTLGRRLIDYATSMLDLSDGLAGDLKHICSCSHVGAEVYLNDIPTAQEGVATFTSEQLLQFALLGGDDYQLCFTVEPEQADGLERELAGEGFSISQIGKITTQAGNIQYLNENAEPVELIGSAFRHF